MNAPADDFLNETEWNRFQSSFHAGSRDASEALRQWLSRNAIVELDVLEQLPIDQATTVLGSDDEPICFCAMTVEGVVSGEMIFALDDASGFRLSDLLQDQAVGTTVEWNEMAQSAFLETTNIVCCAYLNSLSKLISDEGKQVELVPQPPRFSRDFAESLMEFVVMRQAIDFDQIILAQTRFTISDTPLNCSMLFVPDAPSMVRLKELLISSDADN